MNLTPDEVDEACANGIHVVHGLGGKGSELLTRDAACIRFGSMLADRLHEHDGQWTVFLVGVRGNEAIEIEPFHGNAN